LTIAWDCSQKPLTGKGRKMEIVGVFTAVMMILVAVALILLAVATKGWRKTITGVGALVVLVSAGILGIMTGKIMSSPAPAPNAVVEKDFYQVIWEEKTIGGKTLVVVKDSAGEFYFSEFDEPLRMKKVLVVEKGRFKPFLPVETAEKPEQPKPQK